MGGQVAQHHFRKRLCRGHWNASEYSCGVRFNDRIGYARHTIFGGLWEFEADENMSDSAYTTKELRPHTDGIQS